MAQQYAKPTGLVGRLFTARLLNRANRKSNQAVLAAMHIHTGDRVLEIGFGGAELLFQFARHGVCAQILGLEYSQDMLQHAQVKVLRDKTLAGIQLVAGEISALPFESDHFERICSVNTVYFWPDLEKGCQELARVLAADGLAVLGFGSGEQLVERGYRDKGFSFYQPNVIHQAMARAGLVLQQQQRIDRENKDPFFVVTYVKSTKHKAQSTKHKAQSTKHKAQSTKHKAQSTKHKAQSTKHKAQSTKHNAQRRMQNVSKYTTLQNGLRVRYQQSGSGARTVLFVPGWTMTSDVFCRQLEYFSDSTEHRIIALDPRSHGQTTQATAGNHYEQHGIDLAQFIEALGLNQIVLCGWSFGTLATLSYVKQFGTDKLSGFIMLDGPPQASAENPQRDWATYSWADTDGMEEFFTLGKLRCPGETNLLFARWMLEDETPQAIEWIIGMTQQTPTEVAALLNASAHFLDYREQLTALARTLPLWCIVRASQHKVVNDWCVLHASTARVSAYGGHMMFWERSIRFNRELLDFVSLTCESSTHA